MTKPLFISGLSALTLLTACGGSGGSTATTAGALSYQDPAGTGFRLVRNTASTDKHLVLDLLGPSGTQGKGIAFFLQADDAKVSWVHPAGVGSGHVAGGIVFPLGTAPQFAADKVQSGMLQVGCFQKGGTAATLGSAAILSVALDLKDNVAKGAVSLAPGAKQAVLLAQDGSLTPISLSMGTLNAQ